MSFARFIEQAFDYGSRRSDDVQRVRLIRQVNVLNLFYTFIALSVGVYLVLTAPGSYLLFGLQFVAVICYFSSYLITGRGHIDHTRLFTLHTFEWHLFLAVVLTNSWHSSVIFIVTLYPLLAALVETSIFVHLTIGLLQVALIAVVHFLIPSLEQQIMSLSSLGPSAATFLRILSLVYIPLMAAVIINIIFRENIRAREKTRRMLNEITIANRQLENFAEELKDETQRLRAEVDIARRIQTMVLPSVDEVRAVDELDIACIMRPADEVGGDYYDVIKVDHGLIIGIGDVTGHGLSSGIIMLMAQTAVRTIAESKIDDPRRFIELLNRALYSNIRRIREDRNMTFALVEYRDGRLSVTGQHESILIVRSNGTTEFIETVENGFYVGLLPDIVETLHTSAVDLQSEDIVVLYTDGVTEAANEHGEQFGIKRLAESVQPNRRLTAERVRDRIMRELYNFVGEMAIDDDVSLVVIKQR